MRKTPRKVPLPTEVRPMMKPATMPRQTVPSFMRRDIVMFSRRCFWSTCMTTFTMSSTPTIISAEPMAR